MYRIIFIIIILVLVLFSCRTTQQIKNEGSNDLHFSILCLDSHVDTPLQMLQEGFDISERNNPYNRGGKLDFPRMIEGGLDAAFFAAYFGKGERTQEGYDDAFAKMKDLIEMIKNSVEENSNIAALATSSEDAITLKKQNKLAIYIGLENAYPIGTDIMRIQEFYDLGVRYITLTHNFNNEVCDSSTDEEGPEHEGLSEFGREVIMEMNRLGMMIDVSHISDKSFFDVIELTKAPVIASHSNVRALRDVSRNLSDEMLLALKENGGVIQVSMLTWFVKDIPQKPEREAARRLLRDKYGDFSLLSDEQMALVREEWYAINEKYPAKNASISDFVDHIDYVVNLIGIDHVGIGSDFDGGAALEDCFDVSQMSAVTKELFSRGYSRIDIEKIWAGNFLRVFAEVEKLSNYI